MNERLPLTIASGWHTLQVYLEECKNKISKIQMSRFINTELGSGLESDAELMIKLESDSDSE